MRVAEVGNSGVPRTWTFFSRMASACKACWCSCFSCPDGFLLRARKVNDSCVTVRMPRRPLQAIEADRESLGLDGDVKEEGHSLLQHSQIRGQPLQHRVSVVAGQKFLRRCQADSLPGFQQHPLVVGGAALLPSQPQMT